MGPSFQPQPLSPSLLARRTSVHDAIAPLRRKLVGDRQITDAYLLGLAIHRKGKLATFDRAIAAMVPEGVAADSVLELF